MYHIQTKPDCHNPSWSGFWQGLVMYHIQTKPDCHNPSWSGLWQETSKVLKCLCYYGYINTTRTCSHKPI